MADFMVEGPTDANVTLVLAHGAGAPMDSPFMSAMAGLIAGHGLRVLRFEFPYMAERRRSGRRPPPPGAERLCDAYRAVAAEVARPGELLLVGGKSMGGRIAAMVAGEAGAGDRIDGLVCLGYPFHPTGKPEKLRTAPLAALRLPALICQGERDPFGDRAEVEGYCLAANVRLHWLADGDHDLKPRKASGRTAQDNWREAAGAIAAFARGLRGA